MIEIPFTDHNGEVLTEGCLVVYTYYDPNATEYANETADTFTGRVMEMLKPEPDVDDMGKTFWISPQVTVKFDDGDIDTFYCAGYPEGPNYTEYRCDDLMVVKTDG